MSQASLMGKLLLLMLVGLHTKHLDSILKKLYKEQTNLLPISIRQLVILFFFSLRFAYNMEDVSPLVTNLKERGN